VYSEGECVISNTTDQSGARPGVL